MSRFQRDLVQDREVELLDLAEQVRRHRVLRIQQDLTNFGEALGQTDAQITTRLDELFLTFADEWWLFERTGSAAIITAISSDVTIGWLDTDVSGTTIRQRLINRLTA